MKKLILSGLVSAIMGFYSTHGIAQDCTPSNTACTISASSSVPACFAPENPPAGNVGTPYEMDMYFITARAVESPIQIVIWQLEVLDVKDLPEGLNYRLKSGNSSDTGNLVTYPDGTPTNSPTGIYGCARLYGTPTKETGDNDSISVVATVWVKRMDAATKQPTGAPFKIPNSLYPGLDPAVFKYPIKIQGPIAVDKYKSPIEASLKIQPNPANGQTKVSYQLQEPTTVSYTLHTMDGKLVNNTTEEILQPGTQEYHLSLEDLSPGIYLLKVTAGNQQTTRKIVVTP